MKLTKFAAFVILALTLTQTTSCAWFQKNEPKLICAGQDTIADAPALLAIITQCSAIAAGMENIVPCILAAAGSKWTEDMIACVSNAVASQTPATGASNQLPEPGDTLKHPAAITSPETLAKLRAAVSAKWGDRLGVQ